MPNQTNLTSKRESSKARLATVRAKVNFKRAWTKNIFWFWGVSWWSVLSRQNIGVRSLYLHYQWLPYVLPIKNVSLLDWVFLIWSFPCPLYLAEIERKLYKYKYALWNYCYCCSGSFRCCWHLFELSDCDHMLSPLQNKKGPQSSQ